MPIPSISKIPNPDLIWRTDLDGWVNAHLYRRFEQWRAGTITTEALLPREREDIQEWIVTIYNVRAAEVRKLQHTSVVSNNLQGVSV